MSLPRKMTVNCSKCGKPLTATVFESVNSDYADDLAMQIMSGELFDAQCPHCQFVSHLEYDFLYHDMKNGAMIWVVHKNSPNYASKISEIRATQKLPYKTLRIVEDMNALKEKVSCLEHKRDDRIIELCKVFTTLNLLSQKPDFDFRNAFYTAISGKDMIFLYDNDDNEMCCELPEKAYEYLKELYYNSQYAAQFDDNYAIVDYAWAEEILTPLLQAESDRIDAANETGEPEAVEPISEKVICPKCNSELPEDSEFCQYCGSKIAIASEQPKVLETLASPDALVVDTKPPKTEPVTHQPANYGLDGELGLVPNKPIRTNGAAQQWQYLQRLRSINGDVLKWNRRGSINIDGVQGLVDIFDAYLPSGAEYKTVYLNANGIACPAYAPKGFSYVSVSVPYVSTPTSQISNKKAQPPKRKKTAKVLIIIGIAIVMLAFGVIIGLQEYRYQLAQQYLDAKNYDAAYSAFDDLGSYRDSEEMLETILNIKYKNLQQAMQSINGSNYKSVGTQIDELPIDYRDISSIKAEYNQLKKNIEVIQATSAYSTWSTLSERNCTALRNAYANLMDFNSKNSDWDLSSYLESVHNKYLLNLVFGVEWKTSGGTIFYWHEGDDGEEWLRTGLSNDKDDNKEYFYYVSSPDKFGYKNQKNSSDKFLAYRISDVIYSNGKWQLKIYCYSDSRTRTLSPS